MLATEQQLQLCDEVIEREGGYSNHPSDPGGETKYGISKRQYPNLDIKNLTKPQARQIYHQDYLLKFGLNELNSIDIARQCLDWIVNSGGAAQALQRLAGVEPDGIFGPATIQALNKLNPKDILIARAYYLLRQTRHPFVVGWFNRLKELGLWQ